MLVGVEVELWIEVFDVFVLWFVVIFVLFVKVVLFFFLVCDE